MSLSPASAKNFNIRHPLHKEMFTYLLHTKFATYQPNSLRNLDLMSDHLSPINPLAWILGFKSHEHENKIGS